MAGSVSMDGLRLTDQGISLRIDLLGRGVARLARKCPGLFLKEIALAKLLMGGEQSNSSARYARVTGDLLRPSRPIAESPHAQLLQAYRTSGEHVFLPGTVRGNARTSRTGAKCIELYGSFFHRKDPTDIIRRARKFCQMFDGKGSDEDNVWLSARGSRPVVRRICNTRIVAMKSSTAQHRLAVASA